MLSKIKALLDKIFKRNQIKYIEAPKSENELKVNKKDDDFIKRIQVDSTKSIKAHKLQRDFQTGLIKEEDLSEEDYKLLEDLYQKQIKETIENIKMYRERINLLKGNLA